VIKAKSANKVNQILATRQKAVSKELEKLLHAATWMPPNIKHPNIRHPNIRHPNIRHPNH
jgi:hypothetical protein